MNKWKLDAAVSVLLLAFYAVIFSQSVSLKPVARTYPQVLLAICTVLTAALLVRSVIQGRREAAVEKNEKERAVSRTVAINIFLVCAAMVAYAMLISVIGYITSTVLFIAGTLVYLRVRKWYVVAGVSLGTALFLYYMFNNLLGILLPAGFLI